MLLSSEVLGIIAIGFALYFLRIIIKGKHKIVKNISLDWSDHQEKFEPFIDIPMDDLTKKLDFRENENLDDLKKKIEKFKERNKFYSI